MSRRPCPPSRRTFLWSALAAAALPMGRRRATGSPQDRAWVPSDGFLARLPRLLTLASVPGISIAVVENGETVWRGALGVANVETGDPVREETVFPAASLGKPVFASVVLKLVEAGSLELDRPLAGIVRPDDLGPDARLDRITPRHVLSHTTGLPNWRNRAGAALEPSFEPGERFQYSGEGFFWLQRVVETVTGKGIDRVMRERLFDPAGMGRATYAWSAERQRDTAYGHRSRGALARQYNREIADPLLALAAKWDKPMSDWTAADVFRAMDETGSQLPRLPNFAVPNVAGSLICTAGEYARFLSTMLAGGRRSDWEVTENSRAAMLAPRVALNPALTWGLGWGLEATDGGPLFWHWGDNGPFTAFAAGDPVRRRAIVVFTNSESGPKIYQRVVADATGMDLAAFLWV